MPGENQVQISGINTLWMVESHYRSGEQIPSHVHWYYHFFMVRDGTAEVTVKNKHHTLSDGAFFFIRPGMEHSMFKVTSPLLTCYEVRIVTMTPQAEKLLQNLPDILPASPFVTHLVDEMISENLRKDSSSAGFISDYFLALANYLHRHFESPQKEKISFIDTRNFSDLSRSIIQFMEDHLSDDLSLQKIAHAVGYHKNYICAAFKQDTGMTVGNCLTAIRIQKAAELLSLSEMNLQEIAATTGFINFSHFSKTFKHATGTSPSQYRRKLSSDIISLTQSGSA